MKIFWHFFSSGRCHISTNEEKSSRQVGTRRMDLVGHEGGRHRQGQQVGWQVPRIRNLLQLHPSSATISRGKCFQKQPTFYL